MSSLSIPWARRSPALLVLLTAWLAQPCRAAATEPTQTPHPDLQALVAAERAFAADAWRTSVRDAFLAWLDADAVVFRPRPVLARPVYEARPASPALLAWVPAFAAVARSGDAGYTTGPWSFHAEKSAPAVAWGQFVSVWRRRPDGAWRVIADIGVSQPAPGKALPAALASPGDGRFPGAGGELNAEAAGGVTGEAGDEQVGAAENAFAAQAAAEGAAAAYAAHADPELRLYRDGSPPWLGREAALAAVAVESGRLECRPQAVGAARSGELGWAWGEGRREAPAAGAGEATDLSWLRVWRRVEDGVWRIVVDVTLPAPVEEADGGS